MVLGGEPGAGELGRSLLKSSGASGGGVCPDIGELLP